MTRAKKSRKGGSIGIPKAIKDSSNSRSTSKPTSPSRPKRKSGNAPGTRQNTDTTATKANSNSGSQDKRIGSKKPIPLIVEKNQKPVAKVQKRKYATPAEELAALEANDRFNTLLDKIEDEQALSKDDQDWLDQQLARHKVLCDLLGIKEEVEEPDADPFAQLDAIQLDDFKD